MFITVEKPEPFLVSLASSTAMQWDEKRQGRGRSGWKRPGALGAADPTTLPPFTESNRALRHGGEFVTESW